MQTSQPKLVDLVDLVDTELGKSDRSECALAKPIPSESDPGDEDINRLSPNAYM